MTVGLPRSGKSTWARKQKLGPVVCPDAIRLALHGQAFTPEAEPMVWAMAKIMVRHHFIHKPHSSVVLDATSITTDRRAEWYSDRWDTRLVVFDTPLNVCIKRAVATDFDPQIVARMHSEMELPDRRASNLHEWIEYWE